MSIALTAENERTLKRLLESGRWQDESEIVRHGILLVEKEIAELDRNPWPQPLPNEVLERAYQNETAEEKEIERKLGEASCRHRPGEDQ